RIAIDEALFGAKGAPVRRYELELPASRVARLKFPDPVWGRVTLEKGAHVLLVTSDSSEAPKPPRYVDQIRDMHDPVLDAIRATLAAEATTVEPKDRRARYLQWLASGTMIQKAFAVDALAKDEDLPEVDPKGDVAAAVAASFAHDPSVYVRISVGERM